MPDNEMKNIDPNDDDIIIAINRILGLNNKPFYRSKKFWFSVAGVAAPIAAQVLTGQVTWPIAVGGAVASIVSYILAQGSVDKQSTQAISSSVGEIVRSKISANAFRSKNP